MRIHLWGCLVAVVIALTASSCTTKGGRDQETGGYKPVARGLPYELVMVVPRGLYTGELKDAKKEGYSLIIANIVAEIIADIAPLVPDKLLPGGRFITSGIIDHKKEIALSACEAAGLRLLEEKQKGDWHAYYFTKAL